MVEQIKLFDKGEPGADFKKLKWNESPGFWRAAVKETSKEHVYSRCERAIPAGSRAVMSVSFKGSRPSQEDFKKVEYWHTDKSCHEKRG